MHSPQDKQPVNSLLDNAYAELNEREYKRIQERLSKLKGDNPDIEFISTELACINTKLAKLADRFAQVEAATDIYLKRWQQSADDESYPMSVDLPADHFEFAGNWYGVEYHQDTPFRWSGPLNTSTLSVRISRTGVMKFELHVLDIVYPEYAGQIRIFVDGLQIEFRIKEDKTQPPFVLAGILPASPGQRPTEFSIVLPRARAPSDLAHENQDTRPLGMAVSRLYIHNGQ